MLRIINDGKPHLLPFTIQRECFGGFLLTEKLVTDITQNTIQICKTKMVDVPAVRNSYCAHYGGI